MSAPRDLAVRPRLVLGCVALLVVLTQVGRALLPTLISEAPLLLVALSPSPGHLVLAAAVSAYVPFVAVATARRLLGTLCGYYLGVLYGEASVQWVAGRSGLAARVLRMLLSLFQRFPYAMTFVMPTGTSMMAGLARLPRGPYFTVAIAGHIMWSSGFYYAGEWLKPWIDPLLVFVRDHVVELTAVTIGGVVVWQLIRRRRAKAPLPGLDTPS